MNFSSMMFGARLNIKAKRVFIAGAGVTPFIAILRQLQAENKIANNKLILLIRPQTI
jgi:ferredoxin-NADP reductase